MLLDQPRHIFFMMLITFYNFYLQNINYTNDQSCIVKVWNEICNRPISHIVENLAYIWLIFGLY